MFNLKWRTCLSEVSPFLCVWTLHLHPSSGLLRYQADSLTFPPCWRTGGESEAVCVSKPPSAISSVLQEANQWEAVAWVSRLRCLDSPAHRGGCCRPGWLALSAQWTSRGVMTDNSSSWSFILHNLQWNNEQDNVNDPHISPLLSGNIELILFACFMPGPTSGTEKTD